MPAPTRTTRRTTLALGLLASLVLASCAGDEESTGPTTPTTTMSQATDDTDGTNDATPNGEQATATTTQPDDLEQETALPHLEVALVWHQHQPRYPEVDGVVTRPWVRLHAAKDYVDMATLAAEFPELAVTFNLTPVLLDQLADLTAGTRDTYWEAAATPLAELTDEQRTFITERFFDINPTIIETMPRFVELERIRADGRAFTNEELQDLRALFHLGWIDPEVPERAPFVEQGSGFSDADVMAILAVTQDLVDATISTHAELWADGSIEVITTPLAHPILPLIADTDLARVGDPTAILPSEPFREFTDAREHVRLGLDRAETAFGQRPVGVWPGEGAVAQPVMRLFAEQGVQWVATGEDVLARSLDIGSWTRDENDTVQEAAMLYRPYTVDTPEGPVAMFFRDNRISDLIGFEYSGSTATAAVDDLIGRLDDIRHRLANTDLDFQPVVSIILDGENAWEHYDNDGIDFLRELYGRLTATDWLTTTTPTRWLAEHGDGAAPLDEVFPAAWFTPNYSIWIGEEDEARAWDLLRYTRLALRRAEQQGASPVQLEAAYDAMFAAEGSDWFWWYGADQDSGDDGYFDAAYRELLGQVFDAIGEERPRWVDVPIVPLPTVEPDVTGSSPVTISIDGDDDDWTDVANRFTDPGAGLGTMAVAVDEEQVGLLLSDVDLTNGVEIYLGAPRGTSRRGTTIDDQLLGFDASHLVRIAPDRTACLSSSLPPVTLVGDYPRDCDPIDAATTTEAEIELAIPVAALGALGAGDQLLVRVQVDGSLTPTAGAGRVAVPDIAGFDAIVGASDPTDDDTGTGTYTYPTDAVFLPGSYDLTGFEAGTSGDDVVFSFAVDAPVLNPWDSPTGLAIQTFDVYLDVDPGAGTGRAELLDGRNASLEPGNGWEAAVTIEGWESAVALSRDDGGYDETTPTITVAVLAEDGKVTVRIPSEALPESLDLETAGIAVAAMSQEGYPSPGVRRVRDIGAAPSQWQGGGAPPGAAHTRIYDVIAPDDVDQSALLTANLVPLL